MKCIAPQCISLNLKKHIFFSEASLKIGMEHGGESLTIHQQGDAQIQEDLTSGVDFS